MKELPQSRPCRDSSLIEGAKAPPKWQYYLYGAWAVLQYSK